MPSQACTTACILNERCRTFWRQAQRWHQTLSVLMIDIDHFKQVNDRFSHAAGDQALRMVAQTLAPVAGSPGRSGCALWGEEFLALLPQTNVTGAAHIAETIRQCVEALDCQVNGEHIPLTVSIGVASALPGPNARMEDLLHGGQPAVRSQTRRPQPLRSARRGLNQTVGPASSMVVATNCCRVRAARPLARELRAHARPLRPTMRRRWPRINGRPSIEQDNVTGRGRLVGQNTLDNRTRGLARGFEHGTIVLTHAELVRRDGVFC